MSNRTIRINELMQRELSAILRERYQGEAVAITITEVRVSPDLRDARVFAAIVGDEEAAERKYIWLRRLAPVIRRELGRRIVLKFLPKLEIVRDATTPRSLRVLQVIDEIDRVRPAAAPSVPSE